MTSPTCAHHPTCPGCPLLSLNYAATIAAKQARLTDHFVELGLQMSEAPESLPAERISGWRARARMIVNQACTSPKDVLGFYAQGSRDIVPITFCQAHRPVIEAALEPLRLALFSSRALLKFTRFVEARSLDDTQVSVVLCLRGEPSEAEAIALLETMHSAFFTNLEHVHFGLRLGGQGASIGSGHTIYPLEETAPEETFTLANERTLTLPSGSFFQQHPDQLLASHKLMLEWLGAPPEALIDLYCGVGAHGLALLAPGGRLLGMDVDEVAIKALDHNISKNGNLQCESLAASDDETVAWLDTHHTGEEAIVVNPARAGLHPSITQWLGKTKPARVLYMSCNEKTLARDLVRLERHGLRATRIAMLDMMPFAHQLEALVMIEPGEATSPVDDDTPWQGAFGDASTGERVWNEGISGVAVRGGTATWYAVVSGRAPRRGRLPNRTGTVAEIVCERLFVDGRVSGLKITTTGLTRDEELRERLRAWGYGIVGDKDFGYKKVNRAARLRQQIDGMLLHCVEQSDGDHVNVCQLDRDWPLDYLDLFALNTMAGPEE